MLEKFLWNKFSLHQFILLWFQQEGRTAHSAWISMALLWEIFPGRLTYHFSDINLPTHSPIFWYKITLFGALSKARCVRYILPIMMTWNSKFGSIVKESQMKTYKVFWCPCHLNCRSVMNNKEVTLKVSY
jgi:hypothetical protein